MAEQQDPSELEEAANSGDVEKEVKLLDVSSTDLSENQDNRSVRLNVKDKDGKTALHQAVERDDVVTIQTLIIAGEDFNLQGTSYGMSPLMYALYLNKISCVFELLKLGADIHCVDNEGRNPLMLAAMRGHKICLQYLIKAGADVNFQTQEIHSSNMYLGQTALMYAAEYKRANCLQLLLEAGADVNAKTSDGLTALHLAARLSIEYESVSKCMRILLNYAADCNAQTSDGQTPLMVLVSSYNSIHTLNKELQPPCDCVKMLIYSGTEVNKADINGNTVLMHTVRDDNLVNFLSILVEAGAVVDQQDSTGMTPLAHAAITGSHKCVRALLDAGTSAVNMNDHSGRSPLQHAFSAGSGNCARLLLDSGADVEKVDIDNKRQTVLMHAAKHGCLVDLLPKLIKAGSVIDQQDSTGMTALAHAAITGSHECVSELLDAGASVDVCDQSGKSPLEHALLLDSGANVTKVDSKGQTLLMYTAKHESLVDLLHVLVKAGSVMDQQDSSGMTALAHAAITGSHKCVSWLLDAGASVDICDQSGKSPMEHAISTGSAKCGRLLPDSKANVRKVDNEGRTMLMHVARHGCLVDLLPKLVKAGAVIDNQDSTGMTALAHAAITGSDRCVSALLDAGASANICDLLGKSPLEHAISTGSAKCTRLLRDSGADVTKVDCEGRTVLMHAARHESLIDLLPILLKAGAVIDQQDSTGMTALAHAATTGSHECISKLLDAGASVDVCDQSGKSPLEHAISAGTTRSNCARLPPDSKANVRKVDSKGRTLLMHAARYECLDNLLPKLVKAGAEIDQQDSTGMTALAHAVITGSDRCVSVLLDEGAFVNTCDQSGKSPLEHAFSAGSAKCARLLLYCGANVRKVDSEGRPLLMHAVKHGYLVNPLPKLLRAGSVIDQQDSTGMTALAHAAITGSDEYVSGLLNVGASVNICDQSGKSPLEHALSARSAKCVRFLLDSGADVRKVDSEGRTLLMHAARHGCLVNPLPELLNAGSVIDQQDSTGMTALAHAAITGSHECVSALLGAGASVDICDQSGKSPLGHAISAGSAKCVRLLLNVDEWYFTGMFAIGLPEWVRCIVVSEASVNACDESGKTPLHHLMCLTDETWNAETYFVKLLCKLPDVNAKDNDGMTPLMYLSRNSEPLMYLSRPRYPAPLMTASRRRVRSPWDIHLPEKCSITTLIELGADINLVDNLGQTALFHCLQAFLDADYSRAHGQQKCDPSKNIKLLLNMGAKVGSGKVTVGKLSRLTEINIDLDLFKLQVGDHVDLNVHWENFVSVIEKGRRKILQFLILNKVMPSLSIAAEPRYKLRHFVYPSPSVLQYALTFGSMGITKYLIATCYLRSNDLTLSPARFKDHSKPSNNQEIVTMAQNLRSQPWPLVKLCFVAVSTVFGASPGRQERVKNSQLPPKLQNMLLFQEPWSRLCVHQWDEIPLTFTWEEYDKLPQPRPLLYHWPVGRSLVPCDCGKCDGTMYKYELEEEESDDNED